jgi:threonine/homoserine/homoserine lactone efflux protein
MATAGVSTAILIWATGSMLGLSVLLTRLSWLYEIVRLAGAGYLVYLGARTLWASRRKAGDGEGGHGGAGERGARRVSLGRSWRVGFLTNAANPKAVAFFGSLMGALLPPHPSVEVRAVVIAGFVATALIWYLVVATMFGSAPVARLYRRIRRWIDRVTATILILLGGRLALDR